MTMMMPDPMPGAAPPPSRAAHPLLWVYGTLRAGGHNDIRRLRPAPQPLGPAWAWGRLYDLGPYPGVRLLPEPGVDGAGWPRVWGELYRVPPGLWPVLDAIEEVRGREDDEYRCRLARVRTEAGNVWAWVYEIRPDRVHAAPVVGHGDWRRHLAERGGAGRGDFSSGGHSFSYDEKLPMLHCEIFLNMRN